MSQSKPCHSCAADLPEGMHYCIWCGQSQGLADAEHLSPPLHCAVCQMALPPVSRYCMGCGSPVQLGMQGPSHIEERRTVTLLQADVVGFTRLSEERSPEAVKDLMDLVLGALSREIVARGGVVDKFIGDAVVAIFGVPHSHVDDAKRAVEVAMAMHHAVEEVSASQKDPVSLSLRIGIETGSVVVGRVAGSHRPTVTGPSVHAVMELESAAPPQGVLIGEETWKQVHEAFDFQVFDKKSSGRTAYLLMGRRRGQNAEHYQAISQLPLVGRHGLVDGLLGHYRQVIGQNSIRIIRLQGPTGIGKSRVRQAFMEAVHGYVEDVPLIAMGTCSPLESSDLLGQWLRQLLGLNRANRLNIALAIEGLLAGLPADLPASLPAQTMDLEQGDIVDLICHLLGIEIRDSAILRAIGAESSLLRRHIAAAVGLIFYALGQNGPLLLIAENEHWIRRSIRNLIEKSLAAAGAIPLLLLQVQRLEIGQVDNWQTRHITVERVLIPPLSDAETWQLVEEVTGQSPETLPRIALLSTGLGEGNPLLLLELLRHLKDPEILDGLQDDGTGFMAEGGGALKQLVQARLDRLPDEARRVIRAASVIGLTFWAEALERMGSNESQPILNLLCERGLIRKQAQSLISGAAAYEFISPLIRDVAYANILVKVRRFLHQVAAAWLEERLGERRDTFAETLAHHHVEGGNPLDGARYLLRAGNKARAIYANDEALALHLRVRDILHGLDSPEACRLRAQVEYIFGILAQEQGVVNKAGPHYQAGLELLEGLHAPEDTLLRARLHMNLGEVDVKYGQWARGMSHFDAAMLALNALEPQKQIHGLRASIHRRRGGALVRRGEFAKARDEYLKGLKCVDETAPMERADAAILHSAMGLVLRAQGQPIAALEHHRKALNLARSARNKRLRCLCLVNWARVLVDLNQLGQAQHYYEEALSVQKRIGLREDEALSRLNLAQLYLIQGDLPAAHRYLQAAQPLLERYATHFALPEYHRVVADHARASGDLIRARVAALKAVELSRAWGTPTLLGEALRTLSQIQVDCGEHQEGLHTVAEGRSLLEKGAAPRELAEVIITQMELQLRVGNWRPGRLKAEAERVQKLLSPYPSDSLKARLEALQGEVQRL